jgi:hypothetical protein
MFEKFCQALSEELSNVVMGVILVSTVFMAMEGTHTHTHTHTHTP